MNFKSHKDNNKTKIQFMNISTENKIKKMVKRCPYT